MGIEPDNVEFRDLGIGDIGWLIQRHGELYAEHDGFDFTFELVVAEILLAFAHNHDPACEKGWIATNDRQRLGSIFCVQSGEPGIAKLRLFLMEPEARGLGLGRRLLETCIGFARRSGYYRLRLWTHESHRTACVLYDRKGFVCVNSKPVTSFGQNLVEQTWELDLI